MVSKLRKKSQLIVLICLSLFAVKANAQYQPGDTILIAAVDYITETIEAEWNATNETSVPGKNIPMEVDGRTVIGDIKTGSILSYPIMVGAEGGTFIFSIEYKGTPGGPYEGYTYLWLDDADLPREEREKLWMRTAGWNTVSSRAMSLSPGFHTIYTQYKGSSGEFVVDKIELDPLPGTLKEKEIQQIFALSYEPDTIEMEEFDSGLSFALNGSFTVEGESPSYVLNMQAGDTLTYPIRVGSGGGLFDFKYVYKKVSVGASSVKLYLDDEELETMNISESQSDEWESVNAVETLSLSPGYHEIEILINGSDDHWGDCFVLTAVENSLFNAHPRTLIDAHEKAAILDKIEKNEWAKAVFKNIRNEVAGDVLQHMDNPEAVFNTIPAFGSDVDHEALEDAVNAAIVYFLTSDEMYAQYAADVLNYYCEKLADLTPQTATIRGDAFSDGRWPFKDIALSYDFLHGFISSASTSVYDSETDSMKAVDMTRMQIGIKNMVGHSLQEYGDADNKYGKMVSNHPILTAPGVLYSILCVEDEAERERLFDVFWNIGTKEQNSFTRTILPWFSSQGIWPESVSYSFQGGVPLVLNIVDRLKPELNALDENTHILEGSFIFPNLRNPNRKYIRFGDSKRLNDGTEGYYRTLLAIADRKGYDDLKKRGEIVLKGQYDEAGGYSPGSGLTELFWWGDIPDTVIGDYDYSTTVLVEHAGVALQRNYVENDNVLYGLNGYIGGAHYVHSHCTGIAMELYGAGYIMAPNGGLPPSTAERADPVHTDYFRLYAGNNTVIVNGTSHGRQQGAWKSNSNVWQNNAVNVASEPFHLEDPISENFRFATQLLNDEVNNCDQQRTLSVIRTSPSSGYYFDLFRSKSNSSNDFHDYIYHNLGDETSITNSQGNEFTLTVTDRYNNDIGDIVHSPGWRFFENEKVSPSTSEMVKVVFNINYDNRRMNMFVPGGVEREYTKALGPATREAANGYVDKETQIVAIRQQGEAWNKPFIAVFEPSIGESSTVTKVEDLEHNGVIVGAIVKSFVNGKEMVDFILAPETSMNLSFAGTGISFDGHFGIVRKEYEGEMEKVTMYIGLGNTLTYGDNTLTADDNERGLNTFEQQALDNYKVNVSAENASYSVNPYLSEYITGSQITINAIADEGYEFSHWSGDVPDSLAQNMPLNITILSDLNIIANFEQNVFQVNVIAENGSYTIDPQLSEYPEGTPIVIDAIADEGYEFSHWGGDVIDSLNQNIPLSITVLSNLNIVAHFELIDGSDPSEIYNYLKIFPNPSDGEFQVNTRRGLKCYYQVFSLAGTVEQQGFFQGSTSIDMRSKPKGIYILSVVMNGQILRKKIVMH